MHGDLVVQVHDSLVCELFMQVRILVQKSLHDARLKLLKQSVSLHREDLGDDRPS